MLSLKLVTDMEKADERPHILELGMLSSEKSDGHNGQLNSAEEIRHAEGGGDKLDAEEINDHNGAEIDNTNNANDLWESTKSSGSKWKSSRTSYSNRVLPFH